MKSGPLEPKKHSHLGNFYTRVTSKTELIHEGDFFSFPLPRDVLLMPMCIVSALDAHDADRLGGLLDREKHVLFALCVPQ